MSNGVHLHQQLLSLSKTCNNMAHLKQIHSLLLRRNLLSPLLLSKLFLFAAVSPFGDLRYATKLFTYHSDTDTNNPFFYNTLIRAHSLRSPSLSLHLFNSMRRRHVIPDPFSFLFLLKSLSRHNSPGEPAHALALKLGCVDLHVSNALIHCYASRAIPNYANQLLDEMPLKDVISYSGLLTAHLNCGDIDAARRVFDAKPVEWDVVSWTAMISAYAKAGRAKEALQLFELMPVKPDEITMLGVVSACAVAGDLSTGEDVHRYIEDNGFGWMVSLRNALVDMYAKCGCLQRARHMFD